MKKIFLYGFVAVLLMSTVFAADYNYYRDITSEATSDLAFVINGTGGFSGSQIWTNPTQGDLRLDYNSSSIYAVTTTGTLENYDSPTNNQDNNPTSVYSTDAQYVGHLESNASDSTSNSNDGTPTDITYSTGVFGDAAVFDGTTGKIQLTNETNQFFSGTSGTRTYSMWVKWDRNTSTTQFERPFRDRTDSGIVDFGYNLNVGGNWNARFYDGAYKSVNMGGFNTGEWYHIVMTYSGSLGVGYVNGVQKGNISVGTLGAPSPTKFQLGADENSATHFDGMIDEVRMYDRVLTDAEVLELYNNKVPSNMILDSEVSQLNVSTPIITLISPSDAAIDQELSVVLNVSFTDEADQMNVSILINDTSTLLVSGLNLDSGDYLNYTLSGLDYNTTYEWDVYATDEEGTTYQQYSFTTRKSQLSLNETNLFNNTQYNTLTQNINITVTSEEDFVCSLYVNGTSNFSVNNVSQGTETYITLIEQETENMTFVTSGVWGNSANMFDNDLNTYGYTYTNNAVALFVYYNTDSFQEAYWKVKDHTLSQELKITQDCIDWNEDFITIRARYLTGATEGFYGYYCQSGSNDFDYIGASETVLIANSRLYEASILRGKKISTTQSFTSGTDVLVDWNLTFENTTESEYNYNISCNDLAASGTNTTTTTERNFYIDNIIPVINYSNLNLNSYWSASRTDNLTFTETNLFSLNLSDDCTSDVINTTLTSSYLTYTDITSCGFLDYNMTVTLCDGQNGSALNCVSEVYDWYSRGRFQVQAQNYLDISLTNFTAYLNGTEVGNTTTGIFNFDNLTEESYNFTIIPTGYQTLSYEYTINETLAYYNFTGLFTSNSIYFNIYDEETLNTITQNITIELISPTQTYTYNNNNGSFFVDLLVPEGYTIRYKGSENGTDYSNRRSYYLDLAQNSFNNISLYLLKDSVSDNLTVTVYDEATLNSIEGAIVYLMKYYFSDNTYKTVAMYQTTIGGKSYFDVEQSDEYYKFVVQQPLGSTRLSTSNEYINTDSINLYASLQDALVQNYFTKFRDTQAAISYINSTGTFTLTYTDVAAEGENYCFYIKQYGQYGSTTINSSCSTAASGSISLNGASDDSTYYGIFTITIDGVEQIAKASWNDYAQEGLNLGPYGLFLTLLIFGVMVFLSSIHYGAMLMGSTALVFAKLLGLIPFIGFPTLFIIVGISIFITILFGSRK